VRVAFVSSEFVTESNYDGGLANYLQRAGLSLVRLGHEPHVIVASDRDESFDFDGIRVHRVDVRPGRLHRLARRVLPRYRSLLGILCQGLALNRRLRRLHVQHPFAVAQYSSYRATALFRSRSIPSVVRLSSLEPLMDRAYERDPGPVGLARLKAFVEERSIAKGKLVISPSRLVAAAARTATGRSVRVVESPFLPFSGELDAAVHSEHLSKRRYALFFGTIGLLKGGKCLAEIMEPLLERHKELHFVFVGKEGRYLGRPMLEYVRAQAGEYHDRVLHFDRMPHASLYPIIEHAEVVVLPSRVDNFPNACVEAMALGKIVVGTRGASFEQLIDDGVSGFLCEIDDRTSLLAAVERALATERAEAIGARARARIDELRPEIAGAKLLEAYEEVVGNAASPEGAMRRVLMISETFPPYNWSGSQRPFQFAKHLPEYGYLPSVISAEPGPMDPVDASPLDQLDDRIRLERIHHLRPRIESTLRALLRPLVWCLRAARSVAGRGLEPARATDREMAANHEPLIPSAAMPFHKQLRHTLAWLFHFHADLALPMLLRAVKLDRRDSVALVWASGPSFRNLLVGYWAARLLRKPLVLDLRDPWTYGSRWVPCSRLAAAIERRWATRILLTASRIVFTSPLTMAAMQERYPSVSAAMMSTITNGHTGEAHVAPLRSVSGDKFLISYVGSLNPRRRPDVLLDALERVCRDPEVARDLRLQFVGGMAGHEAKIASQGVTEQVLDVGHVSHSESVRYMRGADVNLLLQTITTGQDVISGKAFEYLVARKPILGVVAEAGGDAWLLRETGAGSVVAFDSPSAVADEMRRLWVLWKKGGLADSVAQVDVEPYSRHRLAAELATLFDEVVRS
jgi:glycosyltransferase involved in cell wall biosynthesis